MLCLLLGSPALANIYPFHEVGGILLQLLTGHLNGTVAAACGREHGGKALKRNIQIGFHIFRQCKRAHTAVGTFYIYFDTKTDVYRYIVEDYKKDIRQKLSESIANCTTRYEKEREGIRCFVKYALLRPTVYNIIWGSLSIDKQIFIDYYSSFAKSYAKGLSKSDEEIRLSDLESVSYILMGISSFLGLHAIFEDKSEAEIDRIIDETVMPMLSDGIFSGGAK